MDFSIKLPEVDQRMRVRRSTFIADSIKQMLADGQLKPGDRLPTEEKLCEHFSVSRTTLRESIQMLRVSGLLEVTPGRGSYVRMPNMKGLLDDFGMMSRYHKAEFNDVAAALSCLVADVVVRLCKENYGLKKGLQKHMLNPRAEAEKNLATEEAWFEEMGIVVDNLAYQVLLKMALGMAKTWREDVFNTPEEVARLAELQLKMNSAVLEGDEALARRLVTSYFIVQA